MTTIWVTGSKGQLGNELHLHKDYLKETRFLFTDIGELDLTRCDQVLAFCEDENPDWIVNCAAYTAVDKAEAEPDAAFSVNRDIPAYLAEAATKFKARLLHISTDYVFDGKTNTPYTEESKPNPLSVYAESKLAGEQEALKSGNNLIIRTSWLYSMHGNNFVKTMLRLGKERDEIDVVNDQFGSPTSATDLAHASLQIIGKSRSDNVKGGIYHYSNLGECSWYDFAREIMHVAGLNCKVNPIPTSAYPAPAKRPKYGVMSKEKIIAHFGLQIPDWQSSLQKVLAAMP